MSVHTFPTTTRTAMRTGLGLAEAGSHLRAAFLALAAGMQEAARRQRTRRHLGELDTHLLRDIGTTPMDAAAEAAKPFWRG
jgi:uncharacterized protein YjiS (DUF1127 family)